MALDMTDTREITIGPVLFNWAPDTWRDFYFRIADEAPVDAVYVGEAVCAKRAPFIEPHFEDVVERLQRGGKQVIVSLLAQVTTRVDRRQVQGMLELDGMMFEVNDASQLETVKGKRHTAGPFLNVYNEDTLCLLAHRGAEVFCLPCELPGTSVAAMGECAAKHGTKIETQVFGRIPLALSSRCYHARAHGLTKDGCQFVCDRDPDGMVLNTLDGDPFLTINGIQTMSYKYINLLHELEKLSALGVSRFRLSPDSGDMVQVAGIYRDALNGTIDAGEAMAKLKGCRSGIAFADGFLHRAPGTKWTFGTRSAGESVGGQTRV